jgi:U3 small nucleolar RNA-associated protein 12
MWHSTGLTSPVAYISPAPIPSTSSSTSSHTFGVAYSDGSIRLWSYSPSDPTSEASETVTFNGHKKSPTTMSWDQDGSRLASGGTEGEIVVWDTVAEVGLFRLKGHRGPVTGIRFIPHPVLPVTAHPGYLLSTAKDTYLKLWDLSTQHCVQTLVVGRSEVTSCDVKEEVEEAGSGANGQGEGDEQMQVGGRWLVITGSGDGEGKAWTIERADLARGMKELSTGEVRAEFLRLHSGRRTDNN